MRKLFPLLLIICIAGAWASIIYRNITIPDEYKTALSNAYTAYESGYYVEAHARLAQARELQDTGPDYNAEVLQRNIYYGLENYDAYEGQLRSMIRTFPEQEENFEKLILYYQSTANIRALYQCVPVYLQQYPENETIKQAAETLDHQYRYIQTGYFDVTYASHELVNVQEQEFETVDDVKMVTRKLLNSQGGEVFDAGCKQVTVSQDGASCFVCDQNGTWTLVDTAQHLLAKNEDVTFTSVGRLSTNNIATAVIDGKYRFINARMKVSDIIWEEAGTFHDDVNAVKQNGKWALVTTESWGEVTEFPYTDIPRNSQDCCVTDGYGVVADAKGYYVIDAEEFLPVSENTYEEMKAFECGQPAAYRKGEQWGFVNRQGEVYLEACYEDAKSFMNGYAAVKQDGLWGYIDRNGTMVVEPQFQDALNVMGSGYAYVKNELGYWDYVIIDKLYYAN